MTDHEYRNEMDGPAEVLAMTLDRLGLDKADRTDAQLVELAARKIEMLHDMLIAAGMQPGMLAAVMRS